MSLPTELPTVCRFTVTWHAGEPEQRQYPRTAKQHLVSTSRFESGLTITACERCGHAASDY